MIAVFFADALAVEEFVEDEFKAVQIVDVVGEAWVPGGRERTELRWEDWVDCNPVD